MIKTILQNQRRKSFRLACIATYIRSTEILLVCGTQQDFYIFMGRHVLVNLTAGQYKELVE